MPLTSVRFFSSSPPEEKGSAVPIPNNVKNGRSLPVVVDRLEIGRLRSRNSELQEQLKESQKQEQSLRTQLEEMSIRLSRVEEAEERLCSQLGDFEAEAVQQARLYNLQVAELEQRLSHTQKLLLAARAELERRPR